MPRYKINILPTYTSSIHYKSCFSHFNEIKVNASGEVILTKAEARQLIDLLRKYDGDISFATIRLKQLYPYIYEELDNACRGIANNAFWSYRIIDRFDSGCYDEPEDVIEKAEREYGFKYVYEDESIRTRRDAFYDWVDHYRRTLDKEEEAKFLTYLFKIEPKGGRIDYGIAFPDEIVDMAKDEKTIR